MWIPLTTLELVKPLEAFPQSPDHDVRALFALLTLLLAAGAPSAAAQARSIAMSADPGTCAAGSDGARGSGASALLRATHTLEGVSAASGLELSADGATGYVPGAAGSGAREPLVRSSCAAARAVATSPAIPCLKTVQRTQATQRFSFLQATTACSCMS